MIEQLARTSAEELRAGITSDAGAGLADLHVRQERHRRRAGLAAAAALVLAVGVGVGAGTVLARAHDGRTPTPSHPVPSTDNTNLENPICVAPLVDCLGGRTYRFALTRPVQWTIPLGFGVNSGAGTTSLKVESFRREGAGPAAGVSVLERVRASDRTGLHAARGVAESPRAFVDWVASRPFLNAGKVTRTSLDGHPAWQVQVVLAPGAASGDALCNGYRCHPISHQPDGLMTGIWDDMAAEYTAFRLPAGGTTVVWSWIFTGDTDDLDALDEEVHGLSWPAD